MRPFHRSINWTCSSTLCVTGLNIRFSPGQRQPTAMQGPVAVPVIFVWLSCSMLVPIRWGWSHWRWWVTPQCRCSASCSCAEWRAPPPGCCGHPEISPQTAGLGFRSCAGLFCAGVGVCAWPTGSRSYPRRTGTGSRLSSGATTLSSGQTRSEEKQKK